MYLIAIARSMIVPPDIADVSEVSLEPTMILWQDSLVLSSHQPVGILPTPDTARQYNTDMPNLIKEYI